MGLGHLEAKLPVVFVECGIILKVGENLLSQKSSGEKRMHPGHYLALEPNLIGYG